MGIFAARLGGHLHDSIGSHDGLVGQGILGEGLPSGLGFHAGRSIERVLEQDVCRHGLSFINAFRAGKTEIGRLVIYESFIRKDKRVGAR